MKKIVILVAVVAAAATAATANAAPKKRMQSAAPGVEIAERDAHGRVTKVVKDGQTYSVCTSDDSDGCINPREAGLRWGNWPVKTWPGRPISREN